MKEYLEKKLVNPIKKAYKIFKNQDKSLKFKMLILLDDVNLLKYLLNDEEKIRCFLEIMKNRNKIDYDYELNELYGKISDENIKIKYLYLIKNDFYKSFIISRFKIDTNKINSILKIEQDFYKIEVIKSVNDDNLLLDFYENCSYDLQLEIVKHISNDQVKISLLDKFSLCDQAEIIGELQNEQLKQKYVVLEKYSNYRSYLISTIKDDNFIKEYFKNNSFTKFRLNLIKRLVNRPVLANELIKLLDKPIYKEIFNSNNDEVKKNMLDKAMLNSINYDIDENITIGVELEACNDSFQSILLFDKFMKEWSIKSDSSVTNGVEIISPVLHFDQNSLKELYCVCNFMKNNSFYTDSTCGGHIHLGFDYIKSLKELNTFFRLYSSVEKILYRISNRAGTTTRANINRFACPMKEILQGVLLTNVNNTTIKNLSDYVNLIKDEQPNRYYGLNLKNVGLSYKNTIEFRFPNGEIDFYEIINNIRLFCRLLQKSKEIANSNNKLLINLYNNTIDCNFSEKDRLNFLLDLLFDNEEEKQIYRNRYNENIYKIKILKK